MSGEPDTWWKMFPNRRGEELAAFDKYGATTSVLSDAGGLLVLSVDWPIAGRENMNLRVGFSYLHPIFRPSISAPEEKLSRHQNPVTAGLCLLAQEDGIWRSDELVADMIDRQLRALLAVLDARAAGDWSAAAAGEENLADPTSVYYNGLGEANSAAYFDRGLRGPPGNFGFGQAGHHPRPPATAGGDSCIEIELNSLTPLQGAWLAPAFSLPQPSEKWSPLPTRWVRMSPLGCKDAEDLLDRAIQSASAATVVSTQLAKWKAIGDQPLSLTVVITSDEADYAPGSQRDGFIFILSRRVGKRWKASVVKAFGISEHVFERLPIHNAVRERKALLIGCGAIGSFVALELARAGFAHVTLIDMDSLEPGNYVRWPFGRPLWGYAKAPALAGAIMQNYPWTKAQGFAVTIGAAVNDPEQASSAKRSPLDDLRGLIEEADVVLDASASTECQRAMSLLCKTAETPLVIGYGTLGAAGGVVAQFGSGTKACFVCAQEQWGKDQLPHPAVDEAGKLVPVGCNTETFTGGSFDLQEISLPMVRSAIALVSGEEQGWDVAVLSHFRNGKRIPPSWETGTVTPQLTCCLPAAA